MKRLAFVTLVLLAGTALILSEKRKVQVPVRPDPIVYFIADTQHELTRLPVAFTRLSDAEEIRIGDGLAAPYEVYLRSSKPDRESLLVETHVREVGSRVAALAHRKLPYRFHYIPDLNFINAFALPGGHVFVGGGLVNLMDSEDQLAAVLGHEVEHIDHYHCAERVQTEATLRRLPLGGLVALPVEVFEAGYSKDQELEADREGTRLAVRASYSPLGAIRMFEVFDRLFQEHVTRSHTPQEELARVALETLEGYFRSHPPPSERIEQIRRMITDENWGDLNHERNLEVAYVFWTERAKQALEASHYAEAARLATHSLELHADQLEALKVLGRAQILLADFAAAAATCRKALDKDPSDPSLAAQYALSLAATGQYEKAAHDFQSWIESSKPLGPLLAELNIDLAGLELLAGNESPALALLEQARANPGGVLSPEIAGNLGAWYYHAGKYDRAATLLERAVEQRPGEATFQIRLGWALIELQKLESSARRFETILGPGGTNREARMGRAVAQWQAYETEQALAGFRVVAGAEPAWLNPRLVTTLYSPLVAQSIAAMQAEQQRRLAAQRSRPNASP